MSGLLNRKIAVFLTLAVGVIVLWQWRDATSESRRGDDSSRSSTGRVTVSQPGQSPGSAPANAVGRARLDHESLAGSLAGTDVDGHLAADDNGDLIVTLGVRDFFDYFLSTVGEVPLAQVRAFMAAYAGERLPQRAVDQLMSLLDDYLNYRERAAGLFQQQLLPSSQQSPEYYLETLDATFSSLKDLRRKHLDEGAVQAFFAQEEEYGQYTLDRMAIELDPESSDAERAAMLAELREQLSPQLRASETRKVAEAQRAQKIREIVSADMDERAKRAALAEHHEPEGVDRILDRAAAMRDFQERVETYLAARAPLMRVDLPADERAARIDSLRRAHFSDPQELIWARTYEARADRR